MKQLVINGHLTSMRDYDKGDCVPCVSDGAFGWTSRKVASMVEPEGEGTVASDGGYNHQMLKSLDMCMNKQ